MKISTKILLSASAALCLFSSTVKAMEGDPTHSTTVSHTAPVVTAAAASAASGVNDFNPVDRTQWSSRTREKFRALEQQVMTTSNIPVVIRGTQVHVSPAIVNPVEGRVIAPSTLSESLVRTIAHHGRLANELGFTGIDVTSEGRINLHFPRTVLSMYRSNEERAIREASTVLSGTNVTATLQVPEGETNIRLLTCLLGGMGAKYQLTSTAGRASLPLMFMHACVPCEDARFQGLVSAFRDSLEADRVRYNNEHRGVVKTSS